MVVSDEDVIKIKRFLSFIDRDMDSVLEILTEEQTSKLETCIFGHTRDIRSILGDSELDT